VIDYVAFWLNTTCCGSVTDGRSRGEADFRKVVRPSEFMSSTAREATFEPN